MSIQTETRPFRVDVPDEAIADLRRRIAATRWPSRELVADRSQGVQLATMQELARYWTTDYDWRACEAKLNALPQFKTEIESRGKRPRRLRLRCTPATTSARDSSESCPNAAIWDSNSPAISLAASPGRILATIAAAPVVLSRARGAMSPIISDAGEVAAPR